MGMQNFGQKYEPEVCFPKFMEILYHRYPWLFRAVMMFVMDNIMPKFVRRKMLEAKGLSGRYFQSGLFLLNILDENFSY